ncbi:F-box domain protein [Talaromyces stipitatus ATCC 10500]|uniref:F-box domain protein n=1 Tax=Talaromyces stipitatus (strain ATCC 10500 / CBS 375.48 / QM 6759 / NRRL 1006) TaxID=441959 RepID=B8M4H7_TALSN|nr:F-box domain protein [Talaromyces stipitatus ATCC 10500]EED19172.1 F-box domain protein [Talaromyces stipitatus ATCC 10500]
MGAIENAVNYLNFLGEDKPINFTLVAKMYGVDRTTLSRRYRGVTGSKEAHYDNQRLLNDHQSKKLIQWIEILCEKGLPPTPYMIANFAHEITGRNPGKNWASRWLNKHPNALVSRYSTGIDRNRKRADCAWSYALYFELISRKIEQYNLQPNQIYNMDEKGFAIGIMTSQKRVFSRRLYEKKFKQFLQDGNREWITTIACICADGTVISPALIYMAKSNNLQDSWFQDLTMQKCYFAASETGWTNSEIGYHWLEEVFEKETRSQASRGWRLLILDGHNSHVNMRFIEYCEKNRILLAIFPAHATHTLQPLDVGLFAPLATNYTKALYKFLEETQGISRLTKRDFFRLFWASWEISFTKKNINSGFKSTGLVPFNLEVVLQRFNQKSESRPSSAGSTASILLPEEWRDIRKLLRKIGGKNPSRDFKMLSNTVMELTTEVILLRLQLASAEKALLNEKRRRIRKKPLLLGLPNENEGGAIFFSPSKIQQARELQQQKEDQAKQERAKKEEKKLQQQLAKEAKEKEKQERALSCRNALGLIFTFRQAQIRQQKREERVQEAAEKQGQKLEEKLAKQADLQLQKGILATPNFPMSQTNPNSRKLKRKQSSDVDEEVIDEVIATNPSLQLVPAARILPSRTSHGSLSGQLALLFHRVDTGQWTPLGLFPLLMEVMESKQDTTIWEWVYLTTEFAGDRLRETSSVSCSNLALEPVLGQVIKSISVAEARATAAEEHMKQLKVRMELAWKVLPDLIESMGRDAATAVQSLFADFQSETELPSDDRQENKVLQTPELLEEILLDLPMLDLLHCQCVCRQWKGVIESSPRLQQALCFRPTPIGRKHSEIGLCQPDRPTNVFNPLLQEVFIEWFTASSYFNPRTRDGREHVAYIPVLRDNPERFTRPEASWRRMHFQQWALPSEETLVCFKRSAGGFPYDWISIASDSKMGDIYDRVKNLAPKPRREDLQWFYFMPPGSQLKPRFGLQSEQLVQKQWSNREFWCEKYFGMVENEKLSVEERKTRESWCEKHPRRTRREIEWLHSDLWRYIPTSRWFMSHSHFSQPFPTCVRYF